MTARRVFFLAAASALAIGCQGSIGNGVLTPPGPCEGNAAPAICGAECAIDAECGTGFHCGDDGACTAECTLTGDECEDGLFCDTDGRCVFGDTDPNDCPRVQVTAAPVIPTVQLVIDQSGSMNENFNGVTRWNAVRAALVDPTNGAIARLASRVVFGATLYTSNGGNAGGTCPQLQEVAPALDNFAGIQSLLLNNEPVVDTPTAEAMQAVAATFPDTNGTPRLIILATDGVPDTCVDPDAHNQASQQLSENATRDAFAAGIETVVLSVGDEIAQSHLQRLANAGKGADLASGTEPFFVANNPAELVAAFDAIIRGARTCDFTLDAEVVDATTGTVQLNGRDLVLGTDWDIDPNDPTRLRLLGGACEEFLNLDNVDLLAEFDCGAIIVVL